MSEEKLRILQMVQEGKITATEAVELLESLEPEEPKTEIRASGLNNRFLRVRVNAGESTKINVNIPLNLIKVASKFMGLGLNLIPEEARKEMEKKGVDITTIDFEELVDLIEQGLVDGRLVDVDANDPEEGPVKVEVYVE